MTRLSEKEFAKLTGQKPESKYNNKRVELDGIKFQSIIESEYYAYLMIMKKTFDVTHFLMQVPFLLPGGKKYLLDFLVFYRDGKVDYVDTKGVVTDVFKLKKSIVEDIYPIKIRCLFKEGSRFVERKV